MAPFLYTICSKLRSNPSLGHPELFHEQAAQRKGLAKHLMNMLELIGRRAGVSELVMSVPNSPECGKDIAAFLGSGLSGWATDDLSTVAPKTARAIEEVRVSFTCLVNCFVDS